MSKPSRLVGDAQSSVHQAVDIAFSIADLIGGLFSSPDYGHRIGGDSTGDLKLSLDSNNHPQFTNEGDNPAVIHAAQSGPSVLSGDSGIPLVATPIYVPAGATVPFTAFPDFTKGLLTATILTPNSSLTPIAAVTGRDMTASAGVPLGSSALFSVDGTGISYENLDGANTHFPSFTIRTGAPNRSFTVGSEVLPSTPVRIPFPEDVSGQVFSQIDAVCSANSGAWNAPPIISTANEEKTPQSLGVTYNSMVDTYTLSQSGTCDGVYSSISDPNSNYYTYYRNDNVHFTFGPTGNGQNQAGTGNPHFSVPIFGTGFNVSFYFSAGAITGNNLNTIPSAQQQAANAIIQNWGNDVAMAIQEMTNEVPLQ